jgi:hypothetical protein
LAHLLASEGLAAESSAIRDPQKGPLDLSPPRHRPRAKSVICLFQHGGPSQMDLFDPKPELNERHGKPYEGDLEIHFHTKAGNVLGCPHKFIHAGQAGTQISEILPHTAKIVDDITLIRSMTTESVDHEAALRMIHTGKIFSGRPTWGSWVLYGLGANRQDLPAYVVLSDPGGLPIDHTANWSSGFLPPIYQGTPFHSNGAPVPNLDQPSAISPAARENQLALLNSLNQAHLQQYPGDLELEARLRNYEMAAQMQTAVPEIMDISKEPESIRKLYGMDRPESAEYGKRCLLARRLVERGVRFVQVFLSGQPWDTHDKNAERLKGLCAMTDQPSAGLVMDLKQRGLLDDTIVLWTGEFGRLPISQDKDGRDHNRHGFSLWIAGGGFKRGYVHGATDPFGYKAVQDVVPVPDLHATLLHTLGLNHKKLTYPHAGRPDSLTDPEVTDARVVQDLLA